MRWGTEFDSDNDMSQRSFASAEYAMKSMRPPAKPADVSVRLLKSFCEVPFDSPAGQAQTKKNSAVNRPETLRQQKQIQDALRLIQSQ